MNTRARVRPRPTYEMCFGIAAFATRDVGARPTSVARVQREAIGEARAKLEDVFVTARFDDELDERLAELDAGEGAVVLDGNDVRLELGDEPRQLGKRAGDVGQHDPETRHAPGLHEAAPDDARHQVH